MILRRRALFAWAAAALVTTSGTALLGCKDRGQKSAEDARADVQTLIALTEKDVAEVERGLPEGAKKLSELLAKEVGKDGDPKQNAPGVRSALLKMRQQVPDLGIAKSTFFAFTDEKGIAIRNDFEHDTMAGKDLVNGWPGLRPVLDGAPYAATTGQFPGTPNPVGPDREWVAAVPVKKADGSTPRPPRHRLDVPPLRLSPAGHAPARDPGPADEEQARRARCPSSTVPLRQGARLRRRSARCGPCT